MMAWASPALDKLSPPFGDQEHRRAIRQIKALSNPAFREIDAVDHIGQFARELNQHPDIQQSKHAAKR
jgi:hypothetical protein